MPRAMICPHCESEIRTLRIQGTYGCRSYGTCNGTMRIGTDEDEDWDEHDESDSEDYDYDLDSMWCNECDEEIDSNDIENYSFEQGDAAVAAAIRETIRNTQPAITPLMQSMPPLPCETYTIRARDTGIESEGSVNLSKFVKCRQCGEVVGLSGETIITCPLCGGLQ